MEKVRSLPKLYDNAKVMFSKKLYGGYYVKR